MLGAFSPRCSRPTRMSHFVKNSVRLVSLSESGVQQFTMFRHNSRGDFWWLRANFMLVRPRGRSPHTSSCHHFNRCQVGKPWPPTTPKQSCPKNNCEWETVGLTLCKKPLCSEEGGVRSWKWNSAAPYIHTRSISLLNIMKSIIEGLFYGNRTGNRTVTWPLQA